MRSTRFTKSGPSRPERAVLRGTSGTRIRDRAFRWLVPATLLGAGISCAAAPSRWETFEGDNGLMGYRTEEGEVVIPPRFVHADLFGDDGLASVLRESGWTWIDESGNPLVETALTFDIGPDPFVEGLARFSEEGRVGFFDKKGRVVIPARYDFAYEMSDGLAVFCQGCTREYHGEHYRMVGGQWGMIDREGRDVVAATYDEILPSGDQGYIAVRGTRTVRLDREGREVPGLEP